MREIMKEKIDRPTPHLANVIPENHPRRIFIIALETALRNSWGPDICNTKDASLWTPDNPAFGQCAITALVLQDYLGGELWKDDDNDHYWNHDKFGDIDLTREQFPPDAVLKMTRIRPRNEVLEGERAIAAKTKERYELLKARVRKNLDIILLAPYA
jgi:hypothetical protein